MSMPGSAVSLSRPVVGASDPGWSIGGCAALLLLALCLFDIRLLNDGDTYWHIAAGQWILRHGAVPHTDPFSFTRGGAPWIAHEWLAELAMALAFALGGWNALVSLFGLVLAGTALQLAAYLRRCLAAPAIALTLTLVFCCMAPNLLARPHILVLPVIAGWTIALLRAREDQRAPSPWAALLMLLWANLHGSFVFGLVLLGTFALEALIEAPAGRRARTVRNWLVFATIAIAAAAVTPNGASGLMFPFRLTNMASLARIDEWRAIDLSQTGPFEISLVATIFVCLTRGVVVAPLRALLLVALLHMAFHHNRHEVIAALVAALVLAQPLAQALGPATRAFQPPAAGLRLAFAAAALCLIALRAANPLVRADSADTPASALDHVPPALQRSHVFNEDDFGGYLIFRGIKPFIDGRTDLYGDAFLTRYFALTRPDRAVLDRTLREAHIEWTLFSPGAPIVALLDSSPGWRRLYADRFAVVHMRVPAGSAIGGTLRRSQKH
jgi:hypothetical protein